MPKIVNSGIEEARLATLKRGRRTSDAKALREAACLSRQRRLIEKECAKLAPLETARPRLRERDVFCFSRVK